LLGAMSAAAASAQEWKERPYDPAIGSRWIVRSQSDEVDSRADSVWTTHTVSRGELTIEGRIATGFRITYVTRDISIDGDSPALEIMRPVSLLFKDWTLHATTNAAGAPTKIEDLEEARMTARAFVERTMDTLKDSPKVAALLRPIFDSILNLDGVKAAGTYLEDLSSLSEGQNTGLMLGETRHETSGFANPFGGGSIKMTVEFKIAATDAKSGAVAFVRDSHVDPEETKQFVVGLMEKLSAASDEPLSPDVVDMVKAARLSIDVHDEIKTEDGMTRSILEEVTVVANGIGPTISKKTIKTITLTPAP
jgi:hypothetical protein